MTMAASPFWKVFSPSGEYIASCKYAEDAAAIVGSYGGGEIRVGHSKKLTVWREGMEEEGTATDSYDTVAAVCNRRLEAMLVKNRGARNA
jgi:hypothetical protein